MSLDQLNTSKSQTSACTTFGTSDGHAGASLEAVDNKPRSVRQLELAVLAAAAPKFEFEVSAHATVAREFERASEHAELCGQLGCYARPLSRGERQAKPIGSVEFNFGMARRPPAATNEAANPVRGELDGAADWALLQITR